ncbi:MAG: hypothetical protein LRZ85_07205 [Alphaproteobacteria bacterium]|nr:hypothetical protein [Alphaproteobacteria bacterium]MCD8570587.1 hypothetical protein [Alphaproteobacteria bacterium]
MNQFNRPVLRKAEFIKPPNILKAKVGSGGLGDDILNKAEKLLAENTVDFQPLGEMYLDSLARGIQEARENIRGDDQEPIIAGMLYPGMQLKGNGGMFHYPLVTTIADTLIQYLEVIERVDEEVLEIVQGYHTTLRAVVMGRIKGDGGEHGRELHRALLEACERYFSKHPDNKQASA